MKQTLITLKTLERKLTTVDMSAIRRLRYRYEDNFKEFSYQLYLFLTNWNVYHRHNTIQIDIMGTNIDYRNIFYSLY